MNDSIRIHWVVMPFILVFAGCAATSTKMDDPELKPRVYKNEFSTVFENAVKALHCLEWEVKIRNPDKGEIVASTPVSWRSWGEDFTIQLSRTGDNWVKVDVLSKAKLQVVAWGKNKDNILGFYNTLDYVKDSGSESCPAK